MKNKIFYTLLATALSLTICFFLLNNHLKNSLSTASIDHLNDSLVCCLTNFELNQSLTGELLPFYCEMQKHKFPVLVLRISEQQCDACINKQFFLIKEIMPDLRDRIVILDSYAIDTNYKWKIISNTHYSIPIDSILWETEKYDKPYYFLLNSDLKISNIFVPNQRNGQLTKDYLNSIKKLLSE